MAGLYSYSAAIVRHPHTLAANPAASSTKNSTVRRLRRRRFCVTLWSTRCRVNAKTLLSKFLPAKTMSTKSVSSALSLTTGAPTMADQAGLRKKSQRGLPIRSMLKRWREP